DSRRGWRELPARARSLPVLEAARVRLSLGGPAGLALDDEAAHVIRVLVDALDLLGEPRGIVLRDHAVARRLVELDRRPDREARIALDREAVDLRERALDLAVADDGLLH